MEILKPETLGDTIALRNRPIIAFKSVGVIKFSAKAVDFLGVKQFCSVHFAIESKSSWISAAVQEDKTGFMPMPLLNKQTSKNLVWSFDSKPLVLKLQAEKILNDTFSTFIINENEFKLQDGYKFYRLDKTEIPIQRL